MIQKERTAPDNRAVRLCNQSDLFPDIEHVSVKRFVFAVKISFMPFIGNQCFCGWIIRILL